MIKYIYKILRSLIFSFTLVAVGFYVSLYILLSLPSFQQFIKTKTVDQLSSLVGSRVEIGTLRVVPFSELVVGDLKLYDKDNKLCLEVETIGAGISLRKLITGNIELTYGEIIGLHAYLEQYHADGNLNIKFLIDTFASKDKNKEKKPFELALRNVVLRKSSVKFIRPWLQKCIGRLDLSEFEISNLSADITFPRISDKGVDFDLRRMEFEIPGITEIEKIALSGNVGEEGFFVNNFTLQLPSTKIYIPTISLPFIQDESILEAVRRGKHQLKIANSYVTLSDFSSLLPELDVFDLPLDLSLEVEGNLENILIDEFSLSNSRVLVFALKGEINNLAEKGMVYGEISEISLDISSTTLNLLAAQINTVPATVKSAISNLGDVKITGEVKGSLHDQSANGRITFSSMPIELEIESDVEKLKGDNYDIKGNVSISRLFLDKLFRDVPVKDIAGNIEIDLTTNKDYPDGSLLVNIEKFGFKNNDYEGFTINLEKNGGDFSGDLLMNNSLGEVEAFFSGYLDKTKKNTQLDLDITELDLSDIIDMKSYDNYILDSKIKAEVSGNSLEDMVGGLDITDFNFENPETGKKLSLHKLSLFSEYSDNNRIIKLSSDWLDGSVDGNFKFKELVPQVKNLLSTVFPSLIDYNSESERNFSQEFDFGMVIKANNSLTEFFNFPFRLLVPINISGTLSSENNSANLSIDVPYIQQGKDKLIYGSSLTADINGNQGELDARIETTFPVKRGDLDLNIIVSAQEDLLSTDIRWINTENSDFNGTLSIETDIKRNDFTQRPEFFVVLNPSVLAMGDAKWQVEESHLNYFDKHIEIEGLKIWHDNQFVEINGVASPSYSDALTISLADIDVDYIFDTLQINYVTFGGTATGEISGYGLLGREPVAETKILNIKDFSYNGAFIGDCNVFSRWNNEEKEVEFNAEVTYKDNPRVHAVGGVWVTRDSLSFDIDANKVPVEFIQPFMAAFSSHVSGFATGDVKLFGTFKDIDLTGTVFADSVAVKLDYTNTVYHGSDSIIMHPGRIEIPNFRLYDKNGNSGILSGELTHTYFHEPAFTFRLDDAQNLLCYDTNSELNPDWYGTLYGSGTALIHGYPGMTDITADMTVSGNSVFTFVLDDRQYAQDYQFLTFSDRRKEEALKSIVPEKVDFKTLFKKKVAEEEGTLSQFGIDIRATVTPSVLFTLVMDPKAGDKITARGRGAMQVKYASDMDEMQMYGKYEIEEGNYNFSLQDIILRDFKIKEGSFITFNGDPLRADLDISAAYRVNTNLSDLDKSFANDRELTRTNVPVDAILSVKGNMQSPDITFDVELPTLTQDVERKVKSIISTDDMMNRQIIYLLALNRFYTPEYMGSTGNGGELAAVASTTLSSQLSNILGQLTDKVTVSPSFRSDKGDFSDIEVDVALSSRLLNNRLLINGNFGYRDRNNSSTTFVGDFDVEYLLSRNGNLRLKAYNHFNDQNYYLREALTTQGLGLVFRKDFDSLFRKKEEKGIKEENKKEDKKE